MRNQLRTEVPPKPDIVETVQQIRAFGHLLVDGGIGEQPYIFMREYKACLDLILLFEEQAKRAAKAQKDKKD